MPRYDSDEERRKRKKKKKKRSRSRSVSSSESRVSSKHKKSKKSKHHRRSPSLSPERSRHRRSRSRSRRRSPSYERDRYRSRTRSRSRDRYSRRRSRSRDRRSRSYDRRSRSSSRSRRRSRYSRSSSRDRQRSRRSRSKDRHRDKSPKSKATEDSCSSIPGFADMTPSEQAQIRMQMALKAAAAADEKIKEQLTGSTGSKTLEEQLQFSNAIKDIESSSFVQSSFVSNRTDKDKTSSKKSEEFSFGTAAEFKPDMAVKKILEVDDLSKLAHSNLCVNPEVKLDQWVERLKSLRQKKLEGEVIK